MLLREMYDELEELGGFVDDESLLNEEQEDFLDSNNDYNLSLGDLLYLINEYSMCEYAEICGYYKDSYELAESVVEEYGTTEDFLKNYIDYEKLGDDLLQDEGYEELSGGDVVYIGL